MIARLSPVVCSLMFMACAAGSQRPQHAGNAVAQFPSNAALHDIAGKSQHAKGPALSFGGHNRWELAAPSPSATPEALAGLAPELAARSGGTASEALSCVAHELARTLAEHGSLPSLNVRRFVAGRCGAWISAPAAQTWLITAPPGADAAQLEEQARRTLGSLSPEQLGALAGMHIGVGSARSKDRFALVATFGAPQVELESAPRLAAADGKVTMRGKLTRGAWQLQAYINQGALGVRQCKLDPAFALPAFSATCELDPHDDHAWVQLLAVPPGRLVGNSVLEILALRTPEAASSYQPPVDVTTGAAPSASAFQDHALTMLNQVRSKAGLSALTHAAAQSEVANQVTLPFFQSMLVSGTEADRVNNAIILGLLAGWSVQGGTIQAAQLASSLSDAPKDAGRWLASALELPSGRAVLLDPNASSLALGVDLQQQGVAGVAVTYRFTDPKLDFHQLTIDVLQRLKSVRDARKLGDTVFVTDTPGMERALRQIQNRNQTPQQALQGVLEQTSSTLARRVQGFVWETYELEGIEFPQELLRQGDLYLGAGITQYKPEAAPWAQYAILFTVIDAK